MAAPPVLRNGNLDGDNRRPGDTNGGSPSRHRVTFQNEEERKLELLKWRQDQQIFRLELVQNELLRQQQQQAAAGAVHRTTAPSNKAILWFIVAFLVMIPMLSSNPNEQFNNVVTIKTTYDHVVPAGNGTGDPYLTITWTPLPENDSQLDESNHDNLLLLQKMENSTTSRCTTNYVVCHISSTRSFRIVQSHPLWILQQQQQQQGQQQQSPCLSSSSSSSSSSSFFVVAIVRDNNDKNPKTKNPFSPVSSGTRSHADAVVAVALLWDRADNKINYNSSTLDFVRVPRYEKDLNQDEGKTRAYQIQLFWFVPCDTMTTWSLGKRNLHYSSSLYSSAQFEKLPPTLRDTNMDFPVNPRNEEKRGENGATVLFFGWDSSYAKMEYYYKHFRDEERSSSLGNDPSMLKEKRSNLRGQVSWTKPWQSWEVTSTKYNPLNSVLTMDQVPRFMNDLSKRYGKILSESDGRQITLILGSSVYDSWAVDENRQFAGAMTLEDDVGTLNKTFEKQRPTTLPRDPVSLSWRQIEPVKKSFRNQLRKSLEEHIRACEVLLLTLQDFYPQVRLVWRLPLFVPGQSPLLRPAERSFMESRNISVWDLYESSSVSWTRELFQGPKNNHVPEYDEGFYQVAARAIWERQKPQ